MKHKKVQIFLPLVLEIKKSRNVKIIKNAIFSDVVHRSVQYKIEKNVELKVLMKLRSRTYVIIKYFDVGLLENINYDNKKRSVFEIIDLKSEAKIKL